MSTFMKASEFKAKCLKLMDEVFETGEPIIITKNGRPVAQLGPASSVSHQSAEAIFGSLKGRLEAIGDTDLTQPVMAAEDWIGDIEDLLQTNKAAK